MSAAEAVAEPGPKAPRLRLSFESLILLAMLALLVLFSAVTTDGFFDAENGRAIIRAAALTGIVAVGLTFVTLSGNLLSLSVEQTAAICGVALAMMLRDGWPAALAIVAILLIATAIGALQGGVVALGANPIIVTLGAGAAIAGMTGVISGGTGIATGSTSISAKPALARATAVSRCPRSEPPEPWESTTSPNFPAAGSASRVPGNSKGPRRTTPSGTSVGYHSEYCIRPPMGSAVDDLA